ncbi:MAG TPA: peptidoglycan DD-metalloendopeptidase family protein [Methylophilaceae bacterium]|nr:peptidoglycan DD-metalloendopeptidase family protein [Methylophilaceae bacterium]
MQVHRALVPLLAALIVSLLSFPNTFAAAKSEAPKQKPEKKLEQLHERIESLKKELDSSQAAHAEAADELKQSEQAISEANRKLYELNQQHKQNRNTLESLQQQKAGVETTLEQQQRLLGSQLYQQYLHGQQGYVQVVLQQQDPGAMARQLHYFSYIAKARARLIESMQLNLGKIAKLNDKTAIALQEITTLKSEQEQERQELQSQKNERGKVLKKLSAQINAQRSEINKLKRDEKSLSELVERLARAAAKKSQAKRGKTRKNTAPDVVARNETLPSNNLDGGSFAALKGRLNLPVRGDITNRFGVAREDSGVSWKGLFIKSTEGSEVKSVASGRVVFADWMRGFGNLLIVDHGDGYMSLYGNNQALLKKVGEEVKGGDTIAAVGNSGGNETFGLYYELRRQSKPFDPLSWSVVK